VLVHSSLSSMGHVPGGPKTVISGLLKALGPEGTLLLPALSFAHVNASQPVFNVRETPSNVGKIPEYFRTRSGTIRSIHPTHSVCGVGVRAAELLGEHHLDQTPGGEHSPYRLLKDCGGQILFLGCGLRPNTSMHAVEEIVEPPYLFGELETYRAMLVDGSEMEIKCRRHDFEGYHQRYDRIAALVDPYELMAGKVLSADVRLLECKSMWEKGVAAMENDPFFFVEKQEPND